jgi:general secretion pathway protein M
MQLARREKIALLILLIFMAGFGATEWFILPTLARLKEIDGLIERKEKELAEMRTLQADYRQIVGQSERAQKALERRGKGFTIFSFLESLAEQTNVKQNIKHMKPSTVSLSDRYSESSVELRLEKINLEQLIRYIYRIEHGEKLTRIKRMHIRPQYTNPSLLDATLLVYTQELK